MKHYIIRILVCFLFLSSACKKEDSPSQSSANIMQAKIDGRYFENKACFGCAEGGDGIGVEYDDSGYLSITGFDRSYGNLGFIAKGVLAPGDYPLYHINGSYARVNIYEGNKVYFTSTVNSGTLHITKIDFKRKILSGTFEFTAEQDINPSNVKKVTNGVIDVTFQQRILIK